MNPVASGYLRWFYDQGVWKGMHYRGVRILKFPSDLWNYQEIFTEHRIEWVLEAGTRHGGSAVYFADLLRLNGSRGRVISIDVDRQANMVGEYPGIDFLHGDSASPEMVARVTEMLPAQRGNLFLILDSDHSKQHVRRELDAWVPFLRKGDYLVVEDGCVNGHPVRPDFGPGPYEAIMEFLAAHPDVLTHDASREGKFGCTFSPCGYFVRA